MPDLTTFARKISPPLLWRLAGFVKRMPGYWRLDRNDYLRFKKQLPGLPIHVNADVFVDTPEDLTAFIFWRNHGLEEPSSTAEVADFLQLAEGRTALIDIGAQTGFVSALFARSRPGTCRVLSCEPDPQILPILRRARELNVGKQTDWQIEPGAISNAAGTLQMRLCNPLHDAYDAYARMDGTVEVQTKRLPDVVGALGWKPDLIKIDVESYEHEILMDSLPMLAETKPALQLEVHWEFLRRRGRSGLDFLGPLAEMGYRGIRRPYRNLAQWEKSSHTLLSRLSLRVE